MGFRVRLAKDTFKFSGSHFTIFSATNAECLHGHNYYVTLELSLKSLDPQLGLAFDFNVVKPIVRQIVDELDEHVLLPQRSKFLKIEDRGGSVHVQFQNKNYVLPSEDVRLLPLVNITSEELARFICDAVAEELKKSDATRFVSTLSLGVEETRGQSVFYERAL